MGFTREPVNPITALPPCWHYAMCMEVLQSRQATFGSTSGKQKGHDHGEVLLVPSSATRRSQRRTGHQYGGLARGTDQSTADTGGCRGGGGGSHPLPSGRHPRHLRGWRGPGGRRG